MSFLRISSHHTLLLFTLSFFLVIPFLVFSGLFQASDLLSTSHPNTGADHTIKFTLSTAIPGSGKITVVPETGFFNIPGGLDYTDVDFATSSSINGSFIERTLAASSTGSVDGVAVVSGNSGSITITLASNKPINSGTSVRIKVGTNAVSGQTGDQQIQNPSTTASYRVDIKTYNSLGSLLDRVTTMIAIVSPVDMGAVREEDLTPPYRYNGSPSGTLPVGTQSVSMSLNTDEYAYCRYATTSGVAFASSTNIFSDTPGLFHSTILSSLQGGINYNFYVRCKDTNDNVNTDDYLISFYIPIPGAGEGEGGGGGAPFPPPARLPEVRFDGWAYPNGKVVILKDGKKETEVTANSAAEFEYVISQLEEGVYTFGVWAEDTDGRRSITDSSTFLVRAGTRTTLRVFLPPTIELRENTITAGENLEVFGQSVPDSRIDIWIFPSKAQEEILEEEIIKRNTTSTANGRWELIFDTTGMKERTYGVKARASLSGVGTGEFGRILYFGIGKPPVIDFCVRADLNKDGEVNLVDFSILLYYWKTSDPVSDINLDGIVDLTDFSIMMYCWTG